MRRVQIIEFRTYILVVCAGRPDVCRRFDLDDVQGAVDYARSV